MIEFCKCSERAPSEESLLELVKISDSILERARNGELIEFVEVKPIIMDEHYCDPKCPYLKPHADPISANGLCKKDNEAIDYYDWFLQHCNLPEETSYKPISINDHPLKDELINRLNSGELVIS